MISRSKIESRLGRLERESSADRQFVVSAPADHDCDVEAFLRECGHAPGPHDLVVRIIRFGDHSGPRLVSAAETGEQ
jgi:hypothetical protein